MTNLEANRDLALPRGGVEDVAWDWIDATYLNVERGDDPNDRDYGTDDLVDAFAAGTLTRLPAENAWRGIESAPRDGTRVFARGWNHDQVGGIRHVGEVVWNAERQEWRNAYNPEEAYGYLTEWCTTLPPVPVEEEER